MSVNLPVFVLQSYAYAHSTKQQLPCQSVTPSREKKLPTAHTKEKRSPFLVAPPTQLISPVRRKIKRMLASPVESRRGTVHSSADSTGGHKAAAHQLSNGGVCPASFYVEGRCTYAWSWIRNIDACQSTAGLNLYGTVPVPCSYLAGV